MTDPLDQIRDIDRRLNEMNAQSAISTIARNSRIESLESRLIALEALVQTYETLQTGIISKLELGPQSILVAQVEGEMTPERYANITEQIDYLLKRTGRPALPCIIVSATTEISVIEAVANASYKSPAFSIRPEDTGYADMGGTPMSEAELEKIAVDNVAKYRMPQPDIELFPVKSGHVRAVGYDAPSSTLRVLYQNGDAGDFLNVSRNHFQAIYNADKTGISVGSYLHHRVAPAHEWKKIKKPIGPLDVLAHSKNSVTVANGCGRFVCVCGWRSSVYCDGDEFIGKGDGVLSIQQKEWEAHLAEAQT